MKLFDYINNKYHGYKFDLISSKIIFKINGQ